MDGIYCLIGLNVGCLWVSCFIGSLSDFKYFYLFSIDLVIFNRSEFFVALTGRRILSTKAAKYLKASVIITPSHFKYGIHHSLYLVSLCLAPHWQYSPGLKEGNTYCSFQQGEQAAQEKRHSLTVRISSSSPVSSPSFVPT